MRISTWLAIAGLLTGCAAHVLPGSYRAEDLVAVEQVRRFWYPLEYRCDIRILYEVNRAIWISDVGWRVCRTIGGTPPPKEQR